MKKLILLAIAVVLINGVASAQTQVWNAKKTPCEDCRRFPYKPTGCDNSNCLEQLLSTITKQELVDYFSLPANICDKIIFTRNRGVKSMQDYRAALDPDEYENLIYRYNKYVAARTPVK